MLFCKTEVLAKLRLPASSRSGLAGLLSILLICLGSSATPSFADSQSDRQACRSQDIDINIAACTRILDDPASSAADRNEAHTLRGLAYLSQSSFVSAGRDFNDVLGAEPGNVKALLGRAIAGFRRGDTDHAISDFSLAKRLNANEVDAMTAAYGTLTEVAAAAGRAPPPAAQIDERQKGLIRCGPGTRQDGVTCLPIVCGQGQRLDGNNCVAIVCNPGYQLQGSVCTAVPPPMPPPPPPAPPRASPPLLVAASASRWCTTRRIYSLSFEGDQIVWTDNLGSVDVESVVSSEEGSARTITKESRHSGEDSEPRGTVWTYIANGRNRISVSKNGAKPFQLTRC